MPELIRAQPSADCEHLSELRQVVLPDGRLEVLPTQIRGLRIAHLELKTVRVSSAPGVCLRCARSAPQR